MQEYCFSNIGLSGRITIKDDSIHWCCKYFWHGKREREFPLNKLEPEYLRIVGPPNNLGSLIGVTTIGIFVALSMLRNRVPDIPSAIIAGLLATTAIIVIWLYLSFRNEEWLCFYRTDSDSYFSYCRRGPDSEKFDSFTEAIREAIRGQAN
jgi:hypothetical protein